MADEKNTMTPEDQQKLKDYVDDQAAKIGEIYSQCWESDEFKQAFIENCYYSSYGELEDELKNVKQNENPGIIVTYDGENFSAEVVGVYSREDLPGGGE